MRTDSFPDPNPDCPYDGGYQMHRTPEGLRLAVARAYRWLRLMRDEFDTIYVQGQSGIVVGSIVAWRLGKHIAILRKKGEDSHGMSGAAFPDGNRAVVLDDFVAGGYTLQRLMAERPVRAVVVAVCLYGQKMRQFERDTGYASRIYAGQEVWLLKRRSPRSCVFNLIVEPACNQPSQS